MTSRLTTVVRLGYIHRAYYFKELLSNAGIESIIINQGIDLAQVENGIELQVEEEDAPRALELIAEGNPYPEPGHEEPVQMITSVKSILVPIDFSQYSLNAARYALHVADQKDASIMFVHAFYDAVSNPVNYESFYSYPADLSDTRHEIEADAIEKMQSFMASMENFMNKEGISELKPKSRIMAGTAEDVVLSMTVTGQFDLIIVGSRAAVPSNSWFGTFTSTLIGKSTIPVMAIPEEAVYKKSKLKNLMYATNFDKSDGTAIRKLLSIAAPLDSQIYIVHIDVTDHNPFINFDLAHFREKYAGNIGNIKMIFDLIVNEDIIKGMENYIAEKKIDVLAVTTHKRNIITSFIKPSITRELLIRIPVPLLVFHSNP
jgi:nucleotide-binding universal stress UspA family protein